jgi:hypothetical protein
MKKIVTKTFNRLTNAFKRPIVVEGQGALLKTATDAMITGTGCCRVYLDSGKLHYEPVDLFESDWDVKTVEMDASAFIAAQKALWDGIERRRAASDTVGQADDNSYGGDWEDIKTVEMVMIGGTWYTRQMFGEWVEEKSIDE